MLFSFRSYIMVCGDKVYFGTKILQNYTPIPCRIWKEVDNVYL